MNLTQPAITQGIAKLERQLDTVLFERRPGGMVPTEAARLLAPRVEAALRLIANQRATAAQMRSFVALATAGSYAGAAATTGLAEASLHRAVGDLSIALGQRLVERRGRGLALTARGEDAARRFRLAFAELRSALAELAGLHGREVGRLVLGAMPLSRARVLPDAIAAFHALCPQVDLSVVEGSYTELVGPLRDGEIDLMIGALRDPRSGGDLRQEYLFDDRPVVIGRASHPLGTGGHSAPADLASYAWILPGEGTPLRTLWRKMFEAPGLTVPRVPIECGSVMTIRQILVQTDLLTLLSPDQVGVEIEAGWLAKLGEVPPDLARSIGITTRSDWRPTLLQSRFLEILRERAAQSDRK